MLQTKRGLECLAGIVMLRSPLLFVAAKNLIYIYVLRKRDKKYAYTMSQKNFPKEQKKLKSMGQTKHISFFFKI